MRERLLSHSGISLSLGSLFRQKSHYKNEMVSYNNVSQFTAYLSSIRLATNALIFIYKTSFAIFYKLIYFILESFKDKKTKPGK